jgi:predicted aconitase
MLGWLAGARSPNGIPLLTGLETTSPTFDDLKALCAAFGTTSAAPMLHIRGHTPESQLPVRAGAGKFDITVEHLVKLWHDFNAAEDRVDLVTIGSPHASLSECRNFARFLNGKTCHTDTKTIVTVGRDVLAEAVNEGIVARLTEAGVQVIPDICWCSITEPIFPTTASILMTNSGKYSHYAKGLTGRAMRFGSLKDCAVVAQCGFARPGLPEWLLQQTLEA